MKLSSLAASVTLGASLLLASSTLASGSGNLQLSEKVTLDGKFLSPGQYKVEWDGSGNKVHMEVLKDRNVIATAPAIMTPGNSQDTDGYITTAEKNGTKALTAVFFRGKNWTLQMNSPKAPKASHTRRSS
jgi:hypothetical protein